MHDNLARGQADVRATIARIIELDPKSLTATITSTWGKLHPVRRASLVAEIAMLPDPAPPGFAPLVRRAARDDSVIVLAAAAEAATSNGDRSWLPHAAKRVALALAGLDEGDRDAVAVEDLLRTIATVDTRRAARLLRGALGSPRPATVAFARGVLDSLCADDCAAPLQALSRPR
jgi:hypothetical protein